MKKNTKIIATLPLIVKEYNNNDMVLDLTYKTRPDFFPEWRLDNPIEDKNLSSYFHEIEENIGKKDFIIIFPSINLLQILNDKKIKFNSIIPEEYMKNDYCGRLFNSHKMITTQDLEFIEDIMRNWNTILNTLHYYEFKESFSVQYDDSWLSPENYKFDIYDSDDLWEPAIEEVNEVQTEFDYKKYEFKTYNERIIEQNDLKIIAGVGTDEDGINTVVIGLNRETEFDFSYKSFIHDFNNSYYTSLLNSNFTDIVISKDYTWIISKLGESSFSDITLLINDISRFVYDKVKKIVRRVDKVNEFIRNYDADKFKPVLMKDFDLSPCFVVPLRDNEYGIKMYVGRLHYEIVCGIYVPSKYNFIDKLDEFISRFNNQISYLSTPSVLSKDDFLDEYVKENEYDMFFIHDIYRDNMNLFRELVSYFQDYDILEEKENE